MASSKSIVDLRKELKTFIEEGFDDLSKPVPFVIVGTFPGDDEAMKDIEKEAKGKADNGYFLITCEEIRHDASSKRPSIARINAEIIYPIYIFSNDKSGDEKLIVLWETARDILFRKVGYVYDGGFPPMKFGNSGLHIGLLRCGEVNIYDGEGYFPLRKI